MIEGSPRARRKSINIYYTITHESSKYPWSKLYFHDVLYHEVQMMKGSRICWHLIKGPHAKSSAYYLHTQYGHKAIAFTLCTAVVGNNGIEQRLHCKNYPTSYTNGQLICIPYTCVQWGLSDTVRLTRAHSTIITLNNYGLSIMVATSVSVLALILVIHVQFVKSGFSSWNTLNNRRVKSLQ